ncbi:MAG TPA: DNA-binding response regulator, partial [Clostridiaceae bacterium]|nr:DNA-binding response regulator [Clostridiaceae bacterium]
YMIKPFNPMELVLRIKSLLRRMDKKVTDNGIVESKPFKLDVYSRKLYKNDEEIVLTPTEYSLLKIFIQNPGKAFKRDDLMNMVWGYNFFGDSKIVDVNVRRIRTKIEEDPSQPSYIETVWGTGYRWHI